VGIFLIVWLVLTVIALHFHLSLLIQLFALLAIILAFIRWMPQTVKLYKDSDFSGVNINLFILFATASLLVIINQLLLQNDRNYLLISQVGTQFLLSFAIIAKYFWQYRDRRIAVTVVQASVLVIPIYLHYEHHHPSYMTLSAFAGLFFILCWWCQIWTVLLNPFCLKAYYMFWADRDVPALNLSGISIPSFVISCLCMLFMIPNLIVNDANTILLAAYVNGIICSAVIAVRAWINNSYQEKSKNREKPEAVFYHNDKPVANYSNTHLHLVRSNTDKNLVNRSQGHSCLLPSREEIL
jgi:uncharacterized protein with PQ loop repeat